MELGLRATAKALGISHPALLKATKTGRVTAKGGKYDLEATRTALAANTHPAKSAGARSQKSAKPSPHAAQPQGSGDSLAEAIRRKENALARLRELELHEREGHLVALHDIEPCWGQLVARFRQKLLGLPHRIANQLAAESLSHKCEQLVRDELYSCMDELAEGGIGPFPRGGTAPNATGTGEQK